jgi:hypothetical protein
MVPGLSFTFSTASTAFSSYGKTAASVSHIPLIREGITGSGKNGK